MVEGAKNVKRIEAAVPMATTRLITFVTSKLYFICNKLIVSGNGLFITLGGRPHGVLVARPKQLVGNGVYSTTTKAQRGGNVDG